MSAPQPTPATDEDDEGEDEADVPDEPVDEVPEEAEAPDAEVQERLDELDEAEVETPDGDVVENPDVGDPFDDTEDVDVDLADVDVGEPASDPFDGTESASSSTSSPTSSSPSSSPSPSEPSGNASGGSGPGTQGGFGMMDEMGGENFYDEAQETVGDEENLQDIINAGFARMGVIGLQDEFRVNGSVRTKDDLEDEFRETFETFQLGKYGAEVADEYLLVDDDIDPLWGFAASATACLALIIWMRPDGTDLVAKLTNLDSGTLTGN